MAMKLYTYNDNKNAQKALIAAQFAGVTIDLPPFEWGVTNKSEEFLKLTPIGKVPLLVTPNGSVFESNAIARYVARLAKDKALLGATEFEQAMVDQWIDFAANELGKPLMDWCSPTYGFGEYDVKAIEKAKSAATRGLAALEKELSAREGKETTSNIEKERDGEDERQNGDGKGEGAAAAGVQHLVGGAVTLADIVTVCELVVAVKGLLSHEFMKPYPHVEKYFFGHVELPEFKTVLGDVEQISETPTEAVPMEKNVFMNKKKKAREEDGEVDEAEDAKKQKTDTE